MCAYTYTHTNTHTQTHTHTHLPTDNGDGWERDWLFRQFLNTWVLIGSIETNERWSRIRLRVMERSRQIVPNRWAYKTMLHQMLLYSHEGWPRCWCQLQIIISLLCVLLLHPLIHWIVVYVTSHTLPHRQRSVWRGTIVFSKLWTGM